jgi:hypothetical protein
MAVESLHVNVLLTQQAHDNAVAAGVTGITAHPEGILGVAALAERQIVVPELTIVMNAGRKDVTFAESVACIHADNLAGDADRNYFLTSEIDPLSVLDVPVSGWGGRQLSYDLFMGLKRDELDVIRQRRIALAQLAAYITVGTAVIGNLNPYAAGVYALAASGYVYARGHRWDSWRAKMATINAGVAPYYRAFDITTADAAPDSSRLGSRTIVDIPLPR